MSKIVVSYRRSDSQVVAGRIVDRLIAHFGERAVFMDVDNVPFGVDFRDHIKFVLSQASVMLAVIGPDWLGVAPDESRRIDDQEDPVRVEIETALRQKLCLIPVLVDSASMPKASMLPESMRGLAFVNAAPIDSGRDFRTHIERLIRAIETTLDPRAGETVATTAVTATSSPARSHSRAMMFVVAGLLLAVGGGGAAWRFGLLGSALPTVAPTIVAVAPVAAIPSAPSSAALPPGMQNASGPNDDGDWAAAQRANSFESYKAYVTHYPQGRHVTDARAAAIIGAAQVEPPIGALATGETVLVDDRICGPAQIKSITGGDVTRNISRVRKCISRESPF